MKYVFQTMHKSVNNSTIKLRGGRVSKEILNEYTLYFQFLSKQRDFQFFGQQVALLSREKKMSKTKKKSFNCQFQSCNSFIMVMVGNRTFCLNIEVLRRQRACWQSLRMSLLNPLCLIFWDFHDLSVQSMGVTLRRPNVFV